jgi:hypothetical protein
MFIQLEASSLFMFVDLQIVFQEEFEQNKFTFFTPHQMTDIDNFIHYLFLFC